MAPGSPRYITITATTEGYLSQPLSYTVYLSGSTALLVENGGVTQREAKSLDFYFELVAGTPTP